MMTDPIADMLTRLRNAARVKHDEVVLPYSNVKCAIGKILEDEHFVLRVEKDQGDRTLRIALRYVQGVSAITEIARVSTPGKRVYAKANALPRVRGGAGIAILSTPRGIMTHKTAEREKVGGEVLCTVF